MRLLSFFILVTAAAFALGSDTLHILSDSIKPTVDPPATELDEGLKLGLFTSPHHIVDWMDGRINFACKDRFQYEIYDVQDIEMFDVKYDDCHQPWVMCRHTNAPHTADSIAEAVSMIPVSMRQYIRHVIALPDARIEGEEQTYNDFDTIVLKGKASIHTIIAMAAVSLGRYASMSGTDYWENEEWLQAFGNDNAVLNVASQTSQQANFAHMTVMALVDYQNPGTWGKAVPELNRVKHQVQRIQRDLGGHFEFKVDGGVKQCLRRMLQDSVAGRAEQLPMSPGRLARPWVNAV
ncbi:hypothetical protein EKO04_001159 [Ascochyta lentis]|uniref:Uncharacterized protein n=1 Tax=Ascochyta lentis TaxID=205686 RepID=A0A8H7MMF1_9PLEO|nr:hypothetical protein EKO04_001159 [Ascochyta lentis]